MSSYSVIQDSLPPKLLDMYAKQKHLPTPKEFVGELEDKRMKFLTSAYGLSLYGGGVQTSMQTQTMFYARSGTIDAWRNQLIHFFEEYMMQAMRIYIVKINFRNEFTSICIPHTTLSIENGTKLTIAESSRKPLNDMLAQYNLMYENKPYDESKLHLNSYIKVKLADYPASLICAALFACTDFTKGVMIYVSGQEHAQFLVGQNVSNDNKSATFQLSLIDPNGARGQRQLVLERMTKIVKNVADFINKAGGLPYRKGCQNVKVDPRLKGTAADLGLQMAIGAVEKRESSGGTHFKMYSPPVCAAVAMFMMRQYLINFRKQYTKGDIWKKTRKIKNQIDPCFLTSKRTFEKFEKDLEKATKRPIDNENEGHKNTQKAVYEFMLSSAYRVSHVIEHHKWESIFDVERWKRGYKAFLAENPYPRSVEQVIMTGTLWFPDTGNKRLSFPPCICTDDGTHFSRSHKRAGLKRASAPG